MARTRLSAKLASAKVNSSNSNRITGLPKPYNRPFISLPNAFKMEFLASLSAWSAYTKVNQRRAALLPVDKVCHTENSSGQRHTNFAGPLDPLGCTNLKDVRGGLYAIAGDKMQPEQLGHLGDHEHEMRLCDKRKRRTPRYYPGSP